MMEWSQRSWFFSRAASALAVYFYCLACSLGTEVGNGNKPRPSDGRPESESDTPTVNSEANHPESANPGAGSQAGSKSNQAPSDSSVGNGKSPASSVPTSAPQTGNPADVNCVAKGGRLEPKKDAQGNAYSLCHLPNSVTCESWTYFRGECPTTK